MRKMTYKIFIIMMLIICSIALTSCQAITAQNITNTGSNSGMNGGGGMNGGPGMNDGPGGMNGGPGMGGNMRGNGMSKADLTGRIVSVDGTSIKIELAEQSTNNKSLNSNRGTQNAKNSQDNNSQSQRGMNGGAAELTYTGVEKTLTVSNDVKISQRPNMGRQNTNDNSSLVTKVSDLKKGQVIMIWYKSNTDTVERISVIQS